MPRVSGRSCPATHIHPAMRRQTTLAITLSTRYAGDRSRWPQGQSSRMLTALSQSITNKTSSLTVGYELDLCKAVLRIPPMHPPRMDMPGLNRLLGRSSAGDFNQLRRRSRVWRRYPGGESVLYPVTIAGCLLRHGCRTWGSALPCSSLSRSRSRSGHADHVEAKGSRSDLLKIDTPLYPHIAAVHDGKCSALISVLDC